MDINFTHLSNTTTAKIEVGTEPVKTNVAESIELEHRATIQTVEVTEKEAQTQSKASQAELQVLVENLSDMMSVMRKGLAFKLDESSGTHVVSVLDVDSGDIIRQIPNEEALKLAQKLAEVAGLLIKTEA